MKRLIISISLLVSCISYTASAQSDSCVTKLLDATTSYDQGNYDEAIELLKSTIQDCNLSREDKKAAVKLLIQCYIYVDNLELEYKEAEKMIKIDPNYTPDKLKDDPKLINLFNKFRPAPVFALGLGVGINNTIPQMVNGYSVVFPDGTAPASYKKKYGFQIQLQAERRIYRDLWIQIAAQYRQSSYEHDLFNVDSNTINYSEKLNYLDFPVSAKYYFGHGRLKPYLMGGIDFSILTDALSTTTRTGQKDLVNRTSMRNTFTQGYFGGLGVSYRIKGFSVFAEGRYTYFPDLLNKSGTRYADPINLFQYYYIDDDFRLDNLQFTFGASYYLKYKNMRQ